jgi:PAS domain S-box-containing protein
MDNNKDLFEALPIAVYAVDAEGRIISFNEAAVAVWGRRPALGDLWSGAYKAFHADGSEMPLDEAPIAVALRERRAVRDVEVSIERPDGSRVYLRPHPTPQFDADGNLTGVINVMIEVSAQRQYEESAARLAAIVSSSDDAIISKRLDGYITSWNAGAQRIFGYTPDEMIGQHITKVIPPELFDEEKEIIARLTRGERIEHFETVRLGKDERRINLSITVSPVRDAAGRVVGASKVARDITERKRADEVQRLLHDELHHRIKNTMATVQAIATQTLRRAKNTADFVTSFNGRIQSLARAHGLLTGGSFQGADMMQLAREQLLLGGELDQRIHCSGPTLILEAQVALHLALVLHELGTNARKYGALSAPTGRVDLTWEVRSAGDRTLVLEWRESGGPRVVAPESHGFGSILIEQSLQAHGGHVRISYAETGLTCSITLPLPALQPSMGQLARDPVFAQTVPSAPSQGLTGKRILVVEDEPLIGMVLEDYLADAGCIVVGPAQNLDRAVELAGSQAIDAALVDGNLAGRSVDAVARTLSNRSVPFVFVTGYGRDALPKGFQDALIVEKPFTEEQVISALERLFSMPANVVPLRAPKPAS